MKDFTDRLYRAWKESGISKGEIAGSLGVAPWSVSRWFSGTIPKGENLTRLAEFLSVEANWLVHGETSTDTVRFREPSVSFNITANPANEPKIADHSIREQILDNPDWIDTTTLLDVARREADDAYLENRAPNRLLMVALLEVKKRFRS